MSSLIEIVRERIKKAAFGSTEKDILKVLLGELQNESSAINLSYEKELNIARKFIKGNEETLKHMKGQEDNINYKKMQEENLILSSLLPPSMSEEDVKKLLSESIIDVKSFKSEGQAVGEVMKLIKAKNLVADGSLVKSVVLELRS